jgi:hypothetical protein
MRRIISHLNWPRLQPSPESIEIRIFLYSKLPIEIARVDNVGIKRRSSSLALIKSIWELARAIPRRGSGRSQGAERIEKYAAPHGGVELHLASTFLRNAVDLKVMAEIDRKPRFGTSKGGGPRCLSCFAIASADGCLNKTRS